MHLRTLLLTLTLLARTAAIAQDQGNWRAGSTTAKAITGDLFLSDVKISLNFNTYPLAEIRALKPAEAAALFNLPADTPGSGHLYRVSIPAEKRFLHKNTLCGSEDTQWVLTWVSGHNLATAMFSGASIPALTPESLANTLTLCGTYGYVR